MKRLAKLLIGLFVLGLLVPLGLFASGTAWGEWGKEAFKQMIGYIPEGLERFSEIWHAPFHDYAVAGAGDYIGYILSAFGGMALVLMITWGVGKILARRNNNDRSDEK
ncbi:MAG: PDGLE domain-containing protein [Desulfobacterales bacterium]